VVWYPGVWIPHHLAEPHRNTNTHRTREIQHMKQIHSKSEAPEDGCTNIRNILSSKW